MDTQADAAAAAPATAVFKNSRRSNDRNWIALILPPAFRKVRLAAIPMALASDLRELKIP